MTSQVGNQLYPEVLFNEYVQELSRKCDPISGRGGSYKLPQGATFKSTCGNRDNAS